MNTVKSKNKKQTRTEVIEHEFVHIPYDVREMELTGWKFISEYWKNTNKLGLLMFFFELLLAMTTDNKYVGIFIAVFAGFFLTDFIFSGKRGMLEDKNYELRLRVREALSLWRDDQQFAFQLADLLAKVQDGKLKPSKLGMKVGLASVKKAKKGKHVRV
jgi:hypothetical protein